MAVWEYKVETGRGLMGQLEPKPEDILPYLNKLGDAGWELVVVLPLTEKKEDLWIYKRPMPTNTSGYDKPS